MRSNHREPAPGHGPAKKHLVQWRERSHGRGNSRPHPCGRSKDRRPTSDRDSPRRSTDMREPANKRLITVVSRLAPTVARSSHNNFSRVFGEGGLWLRPRLDKGHKRMRSVGFKLRPPIRCEGLPRMSLMLHPGYHRCGARQPLLQPYAARGHSIPLAYGKFVTRAGSGWVTFAPTLRRFAGGGTT